MLNSKDAGEKKRVHLRIWKKQKKLQSLFKFIGVIMQLFKIYEDIRIVRECVIL